MDQYILIGLFMPLSNYKKYRLSVNFMHMHPQLRKTEATKNSKCLPPIG